MSGNDNPQSTCHTSHFVDANLERVNETLGILVKILKESIDKYEKRLWRSNDQPQSTWYASHFVDASLERMSKTLEILIEILEESIEEHDAKSAAYQKEDLRAVLYATSAAMGVIKDIVWDIKPHMETFLKNSNPACVVALRSYTKGLTFIDEIVIACSNGTLAKRETLLECLISANNAFRRTQIQLKDPDKDLPEEG